MLDYNILHYKAMHILKVVGDKAECQWNFCEVSSLVISGQLLFRLYSARKRLIFSISRLYIKILKLTLNLIIC